MVSVDVKHHVYLLTCSLGRMVEANRSNLSWSEPSVLSVVAAKRNSIVQELCESRGGRPGLSVLTSLLVSVDVKLY